MTALDFAPWVAFALIWISVGWVAGYACRD